MARNRPSRYQAEGAAIFQNLCHDFAAGKRATMGSRLWLVGSFA